LLKRFEHGNTHQVYAFDKSTGKTFSGAANKLAAERKFYDFEFMGVPASLEQSVGALESKTAQWVEAILQRGRLATQGPDLIEERSTIIRFLAVQLVRTPGALAQQNDAEDMPRMDPKLSQGPRIGVHFGQSISQLDEHGRER
jgi:Protein of unknown function (DUF4238)